MRRIAPLLFALLLCAAAAMAQEADDPAEAGADGAAPPPAEAAPEPDAADLVTLEFAGGTVAELCDSVGEATGERAVPRRYYDRAIPEFTVPGEPPEGEPVSAFAGMGPQQPRDVSDAEGVDAETLRMVVGGYVRVGFRPGWVIEPAPEEAAPEDAPGDRELIESRDRVELPFVAFEAVTIEELVGELFTYSRLPVVIDNDVRVPDGTFSVNVENIEVAEVIRMLANDLEARARPVWVAYDITVDLQEFLEAVTDDEIQSISDMLGFWDNLSDEQKQALMDMFFNRFKQMPADERAMMLNMAQFFLGGIAGRLGSMDPGMLDGVMGQLQGFTGDFGSWYGTLSPGDRSELSGLYGTMNGLFGGGGGRNRTGRPGT